MRAGGPGGPPPERSLPMPDKEPAGKISRIFGLGRIRQKLPLGLTRKKLAWDRHDQAAKIILLAGLSLCLTFILVPKSTMPLRQYQVGDVARQNIKAIGDILVEDVQTTVKKQQELIAGTPPVFDLQQEIADQTLQRLQKAMDFMRRTSQELLVSAQQAAAGGKSAHKATVSYKALLEKKPEFDKILGVAIPNPTFHLLAKNEFSPYLEAMASQVLSQFFNQGVISNRGVMNPEIKEIVLRRLPSRNESLIRAPFGFVELDEGRKSAAGYCREVAVEFSPAERWLVCDLTQYLLTPNVSPNWAETIERQQARLQELKPVYFKVKRGEMLVREGERLTPLDLAKLQAQLKIYPRSRGFLIFLGIFFSLALLFAVCYQLARVSLRQFPGLLRDLAFIGALLLAGVLINKGFLLLGESLGRNHPLVAQNMVYWLPLGLAPIFAAMFLGLETGVGVAFLGATLTALMVPKPFPLFLYFVVAGLVAVWGVKNCRRRSALIRAGLFIGLVDLILVGALKLLEFPIYARDVLMAGVFAMSGGLVTGILALGLTPIMEAGFRFSSNIRLLELLNLDQPVLKELMLLAPGTYHHSLVVGQMVEAAAEAIDGNPLLAKAAAYYHDIGKIKKPAYFVENQGSGENKHEKLAPSMSSLILIAHVKEGVDLARKQHLGEGITDIIRQHHGTNLINYFYHKAKKQAAQPQQVNIQDYRYPGPKPQTKEAGLVMLADQVEAASKTLTDPTPARIQGMVQKIINNVFADGQLDECELTLKDLHLIAKSFNKILSGIFHHRVHYPQPAEKKKSHEDLDKQPAKKNGAKSGEAKEKSREDLKRLGMG
jgi:putative nucleotidyltransferase with HDIG domain